MFEEFLFSQGLSAVADRKALKNDGISRFQNSGQANTIHESIPPAKAFRASALAQEFGLTSFFFQSYIPQSFPRNEHPTFR
jgi:hypothetical protein